jgi:predicted anti-sigma-YlaC factor YlaD
MKCQDIERLVIDSSEEDLNEEQRKRIEKHLARCPRCRKFQKDLEKIRAYLEEINPLSPSVEVESRTRHLCHVQMGKSLSPEEKTSTRTHKPAIPIYIWVALVSLTVLTLILTLPLITGITSGQPLPLPLVGVLVLVIQNAVMLCFSPILLRKYRMKNQGFEPYNKSINAL